MQSTQEKRKVIDIFPPKRFEQGAQHPAEQREARPERASFGAAKKTAAVFALVAACGLGLHFFFAEVSVTVWPQVQKVRVEKRITAQLGYEKINMEKSILPATMFQGEKEMTQVFPSSGKKTKEQKAEGFIRVSNANSTSPQVLVVQTRFISEDGKLFRSKTRTVIPGGRYEGGKLVPGFLDVAVTATEPGEEYNIEPSNFSLPGLAGSASYTKVYGKSAEPMKGGAKIEVAVVTESDIETAKEALVESVTLQATQSLFAKIPGEFLMLEESIASEVLEDRALVKEGAELDQFHYTAKVQVTGFAFLKEEASLLARNILVGRLSGAQKINEETLRIAYKGESPGKNSGVLSIDANVSADVYEEIDLLELEKKLSGSAKSELQHTLSEYPELAKAEFSFWPFWLRAIPKNTERIAVEFLL